MIGLLIGMFLVVATVLGLAIEGGAGEGKAQVEKAKGEMKGAVEETKGDEGVEGGSQGQRCKSGNGKSERQCKGIGRARKGKAKELSER